MDISKVHDLVDIIQAVDVTSIDQAIEVIKKRRRTAMQDYAAEIATLNRLRMLVGGRKIKASKPTAAKSVSSNEPTPTDLVVAALGTIGPATAREIAEHTGRTRGSVVAVLRFGNGEKFQRVGSNEDDTWELIGEKGK